MGYNYNSVVLVSEEEGGGMKQSVGPSVVGIERLNSFFFTLNVLT